MTTGRFTSQQLADQAAGLVLPRFNLGDAIALGMLATQRATAAGHAIVIEVHHLGRLAFRAALPGSLPDSDDWIERKARVVQRFGASTLAVRVKYEERGTTFSEATGLPESQYAAHGGGWPIEVARVGMVGGFFASGLPQVEDHQFLVDCLTAFAASQTSR